MKQQFVSYLLIHIRKYPKDSAVVGTSMNKDYLEEFEHGQLIEIS